MVIPRTEIIVTRDHVELARFVVEPGGYVVGSDPSAHIVVAAEGVALFHAHLTVTATEMHIQDFGSEAGTHVAGQKIAENTRIWPNQKIQIGSATIEARRLKIDETEGSLAPQSVAVRQLLPEEFRRERKYEVRGVIAQGGMGAVLDAREATTHRSVAMKVMLADANSETVERFIAEAQITSQLEHPNIVPVHELGVDEHDQVFYTMKRVHGVTLLDVLDRLEAGDAEMRRAYPLRRLLIVFLRVCEAVGFAHSRGVLHRDLKPANIMIGDFGEVLVMDWGLARLIGLRDTEKDAAPTRERVRSVRADNLDTATLVGSVVGTPHYMSPEQASGETEFLDERSDVWALGAILRHILTLARPVPGTTVTEVLANVRLGHVAPIPARAAHCPGGRVPESLIAVASKAQTFEAVKRYRSVEELRTEIDAYLGGFATEAEQAGSARQLWLLMLRHRTVTAALAVLLVVSVIFVVQLAASERKATHSALIARAAEVRALGEKETARKALALSRISLAEAAGREHDSRTMQAALEDVPEDLRDIDWRYLHARADSSVARIAAPAGQFFVGAAAHPLRPGVFALADSHGDVSIVDARTGKTELTFSPSSRQKGGVWYRALAFSPDGERLALGSYQDGAVAIYRVSDGTQLVEWPATGMQIVEFSPDGTRLLACWGTIHTDVFEAQTGRTLWSSAACQSAAFMPDGNLVTSSRDGLRVLDAQTFAPTKQYPALHDTTTGIALTRDGSRVFTTGGDGWVHGTDLATGATTFHARVSERHCWPRVDVTRDGRFVVGSTGVNDGHRNLRVWDAQTGTPMPALLGASSTIEDAAIHPLSDELIVTGVDTRIWSLATRTHRWQIPSLPSSSVFCGSDDLFVGYNTPLRLDAPGHFTALPWPFAKTARANSASVRGGVLALGTVGGGGRPSTVALFRQNAEKFTPIGDIEYRDILRIVRVSPDGARVAMADHYFRLVVHDIATHTSIDCEPRDIRNITAFTWLGREHIVGLTKVGIEKVATRRDEITLWDATTGRQLRTVASDSILNAVAAAPDGLTFAEGGDDKHVRLRDAATLAVKFEFRAHDAPITALAFHPTKPILATGSADLTARLWNLRDGSLIEEIRLSGKDPIVLDFSPSGDFLACGDSATSRIWHLAAPAK